MEDIEVGVTDMGVFNAEIDRRLLEEIKSNKDLLYLWNFAGEDDKYPQTKHPP